MTTVDEMIAILQPHLQWHRSRVQCLCMIILALIRVRTVNLVEQAAVLGGRATSSSNYKRLQRFFKHAFCEKHFALAVASLFSLPCQWIVILDRTNWEIGSKSVNILFLAVAHEGAAIPLLWTMLHKKGNSNTAERIELIERFLRIFGADRVQCLTADREFIGKEWIGLLRANGIPFRLRVKANTKIANARGKPVRASHLFRYLPLEHYGILSKSRRIWDQDLHIAGLRLQSGDYLILITDRNPDGALADYARRWEIETLFGCLKTRGFRFEDTRMVDPDRLSKLVAVLTLAFCWAHSVGEWLNAHKPIRIKKHGRRAVSIFRLGLDWLRRSLAASARKTDSDIGVALRILADKYISPNNCSLSLSLSSTFQVCSVKNWTT